MTDLRTIISATNLVKTYGKGRGRVTALDDVSIEIYEGEVVAIMGPSGCGKSTLLNALSGLDVPERGEINVDSVNVRTVTGMARTKFTREYCGFVFQDLILLPAATVFDNVEAPLILAGASAEDRKRLVPEMIDRVGMTGFEQHLPDELSGGQQQRIGIARALINGPVIVFADEPTSNLDSENAKMITQLLVDIARQQDTTVVIVTHDSMVAEYADRVVRLHSGKLDRGASDDRSI